MIVSGDVRYFCDACNALIDEPSEERVIRCPYCGKSIARGVCATWDSGARFGRVEIIVNWSNACSMRTLRSWRTAYF